MIMRTDWLAVFTSSETYMPSERAYLCVVEDAIIQHRSYSSIVRVWVKLGCEKALSFQDKVRQLVLKFGFGVDHCFFCVFANK